MRTEEDPVHGRLLQSAGAGYFPTQETSDDNPPLLKQSSPSNVRRKNLRKFLLAFHATAQHEHPLPRGTDSNRLIGGGTRHSLRNRHSLAAQHVGNCAKS